MQPSRPIPGDERVLPAAFELAWQRFKNPSNLRVAREVCGDCHLREVENTLKSLHATTTGHLGDGYYEHGLVRDKTPRYSIFPVRDEDGDVPEGALNATTQVPPSLRNGKQDRIETHYSDLPRKACMQCHLYSEGRAVDGRLGMDGDYRGEGCAACHVTYADDGRSRSRDKSADRVEPGHPIEHRFTKRIPTSTCTRCHYGDASIGLHFRGMAQLVPGMPAGPDVKGTTDALQNGVFYIQDPDLTPPDIHHQRGMHCIDCHTAADTMGDGNLWPQMDHAVEIECTSCHGTIDAVSDLTTSHGRRVTNLFREGDEFWLVSKVTGERHRVKQAKDVVTKGSPDFSERAAKAMTAQHARLECYTCHNGWNVDFFGFHFDRNEQFTQLDLISGERTPGRVTTQEKVFATFNQLRLGWNHEGMIAPYVVGFSTIGSARDEHGDILLHQATPETAAGLSGVTIVPHQLHTTRPEARDCVECHRAPATYGLGSVNFRLTREFGYAITKGAFHSIAVDTRNPARTQPVASLALDGEAKALAVRMDPVYARATQAYVALADGTLAVVDLHNPSMPRADGRVKARLQDPRRMVTQGDWLFVADGFGGVVALDTSDADEPKPAAAIPTTEARALALEWPWLLVADGAGGLVILDVADPAAMKFIASVDLNGSDSGAERGAGRRRAVPVPRGRGRERAGRGRDRADARAQPGVRRVRIGRRAHRRLHRPDAARGAGGKDRASGVPLPARGRARGDGEHGVRHRLGRRRARSGEHDYLYVALEEGRDDDRRQAFQAFDVSDPLRPGPVKNTRQRLYGGTGELLMFRAYNEPFLQHFVLATGAGGLGTLIDVSRAPTTGSSIAATWDDLSGVIDIQLEEFAFDRLQDERGRWIKDISHAGCRYLTRDEMLKVLRADVPVSGYEIDRVRCSPRDADEPAEYAMNRTVSVLALVVLGAVLAVPVRAQGDDAVLDAVFKRYDRDGDGHVSRAEFPGSDAQFAELDADKSGGVDRAEFGRSTLAKRILVARKKDADAPRARVELATIALRRLEAAARFDLDHDGRVSKAEWTGPPHAFDEIDLDGDGDLDRADRELAKRDAPAASGEAVLPEFSKRLDGVDAVMKKLDRDGDGKLTRREVGREKLAAAFDWADQNGDGALDVDELRRLERAVAERIAARDMGSAKQRAYRVPFAAWDTNHDERLEPAEWKERKYLFARVDQNRDAMVTKDEVARYERSVEGTTFVERFDLDGDGRVTLEEFGGARAAFARADRNGDGVVTRADR